MTWTLTTSGAAILKAGAHANSTIIASGSALGDFCDEAEGKVQYQTGCDWVTNYSSLSTQVKGILNSVTASLIAMRIISYDNTGYLSREADMLMNMNDDAIKAGVAVLDKYQKSTLKTPS